MTDTDESQTPASSEAQNTDFEPQVSDVFSDENTAPFVRAMRDGSILFVLTLVTMATVGYLFENLSGFGNPAELLFSVVLTGGLVAGTYVFGLRFIEHLRSLRRDRENDDSSSLKDPHDGHE